MNKHDANAHALAFRKTFDACTESYQDFSVGRTLVIDWSDADIQGLAKAVGKELEDELLRGCNVHWARSWQRVQ